MAQDTNDGRPGYYYVVTQPGKDWEVWMWTGTSGMSQAKSTQEKCRIGGIGFRKRRIPATYRSLGHGLCFHDHRLR